jgi:hypothetical protein
MSPSGEAGYRCESERQNSNQLRGIDAESGEHAYVRHTELNPEADLNAESTMIEGIFATFGIVALLLFLFIPPARSVAITCVVGWLLLPVGNFPAESASVIFPYWITGAAVPSDMILTKMWWPPVVAFSGALLTDRNALLRFRPRWVDIPMALWCGWPIAQWAFVQDPVPEPWIGSLYLLAAWGAPWLLGRVYFGGPDRGMQLLSALVATLIVLAPIALIEGILGPRVYGWLYEPHPFRFDGQERYFGFRPLVFFEHGNQYGIWVAATALSAIWLWRSGAEARSGIWPSAAAALGFVVALASQSVGALLLLFAGLAFCWTAPFRFTRRMLALSLVLISIGGAAYLSGRLPLRDIAEKTAIGHRVVDLLRISGRGSLTWRIARDQSALDLIRLHPVVGTARWDWWRKNGQRPWGLWLLIAGQFGLVGSLLACSSLLAPPILRMFGNTRSVQYYRVSIPLAAIVLMAIGDALLNSFFFYPAIVAAGALATASLDRSPFDGVDDQDASMESNASTI